MVKGDGNLGGALVGLMGVAIMADVAGKMMRGQKQRASYKPVKKRKKVNQFGL